MNLGKLISSSFSMSNILSFKEKKHDIYRGEDCMKKFCECLKKHLRRIINFKKKKRTGIIRKGKTLLYSKINTLTIINLR